MGFNSFPGFKKQSAPAEQIPQNTPSTPAAESKESTGSSYKGFVTSVKALTALGMVSFGGAALAEQSSTHSAASTGHQVERLHEVDTTNPMDAIGNFGAGISERFHTIDKDGNAHINLWALISPVQAEISHESTQTKQATINVPFRYSRGFNTANATTESERKIAVTYIQDQMRKEFAEKIVSWGPGTTSEDVYRHAHQGEKPVTHKVAIENITVTGLASAEGHASEGYKTMEKGHIDAQNISLAETRAADIDPLVHDALQSMGIDASKISTLEAQEVQFTDDEMSALEKAAQAEGITDASSALEAAYLLIQEDNAGTTFKDPATKILVDKILESKRGVDVEITYKQDQKTTHLIPLPLLLLGYLPLRRFKRRKDSQKQPEANGESGTPKVLRERFSPTRIDGEHESQYSTLEVSPQGERFGKKFEEVESSLETSQEKKVHIRERLLVDEFNPYLGTEKDDIGYLEIILDNADKALGLFSNGTKGELSQAETELNRSITHEILRRWENNDHVVRYALGEPVGDKLAWEGLQYSHMPGSTKEIPYWQDEDKMLWAQQASEGIIHFITVLNEGRPVGKPEFDPHNKAKPEDFKALTKKVYEDIASQMKELLEQQRLPEERGTVLKTENGETRDTIRTVGNTAQIEINHRNKAPRKPIDASSL